MKEKPEKPSADFPLFAHACGKWAKKINGKLQYFGRWEDPEGALAEYRDLLDQQAPSGPPSRPACSVNGLTLLDACNLFLGEQDQRLKAGEIAPVTFAEYKSTCQRLLDHIGRETLANCITPSDFASYKASRSQTCNIQTVGNEISRVRTLFKWLKDSRYIRDVEFGPGFRKPPAKVLRRHRRKQGKKLYSAEQVQLILDECGVHLRAMVLLGINCGFGPSDCCRLPLEAVERDWIDFPRPKTEVERTCPLWPETEEAMQLSLSRRRPSKSDRYFVRHDGKPFLAETVIKRFSAARRAAGVNKGGFYWLRHTFQTIGGRAKDQVALNHIMGHVDSSMAAVYREEIDRDRLAAVTGHVRSWLFTEESP